MSTGSPHPPSHSLAEEKQMTLRLLAVLQQEQAMLSGGDPIDLPAVISEKAHIVSQMAALADQRHTSLSAAGFDASETGMQVWIDQNGSATDRQFWEELFTLAQSAKEFNRVNGMLIGKQMAINQNVIQVLQNRTHGTFYGPDGQSSLRSSGRPLGIG